MGAMVYRFCRLVFSGRAARFLLLLLRYDIHLTLLWGEVFSPEEKCVKNYPGDVLNSMTINGNTLNGIAIKDVTVIKVTPPSSPPILSVSAAL
jgi:hypothetical protein